MDECEKARKKQNRALSAQLESQSYKSAIKVLVHLVPLISALY